MFNRNKFYLGIGFLVQAISFLGAAIMLFNKKRTLANIILALAAIGGAASAVLLYLDYKDEIKWRKILDSADIGLEDELDDFGEWDGLDPVECYCDGDASCGDECENCKID